MLLKICKASSGNFCRNDYYLGLGRQPEQKGESEFKMFSTGPLEGSKLSLSISMLLLPIIPWPEVGQSMGTASLCTSPAV